MAGPKSVRSETSKLWIVWQLTVFSALCGTTAFGEVLWDQPPTPGESPAFASQAFPDAAQFDAYQFDDFSVQQSYYIRRVSVSGVEVRRSAAEGERRSEASNAPQLWADLAAVASEDLAVGGSALYNAGVVGEIWDGLPGSGEGTVVMHSVSGSEELETATLELDFDGQTLYPGHYWLTVHVTRPMSAGSQWFWLSTNQVQGSEHYFYNPGGGLGKGTNPIPASQLGWRGGHQKSDMVFTIEGRPTTEENRPQLLQEY